MTARPSRGRAEALGAALANEHNHFGGTVEQYEDAVFLAAIEFTCFRKPARFVRETKRFAGFPQAIAEAGDDVTACVYAVTAQGRSVMLPRQLWPYYSRVWELKCQLIRELEK